LPQVQQQARDIHHGKSADQKDVEAGPFGGFHHLVRADRAEVVAGHFTTNARVAVDSLSLFVIHHAND
jgi:hypothetical protein